MTSVGPPKEPPAESPESRRLSNSERRREPPPSTPDGYLHELPALTLLDRLPTPMLATGLDGVLIYANPAFATMLGHPSTTTLTEQLCHRTARRRRRGHRLAPRRGIPGPHRGIQRATRSRHRPDTADQHHRHHRTDVDHPTRAALRRDQLCPDATPARSLSGRAASPLRQCIPHGRSSGRLKGEVPPSAARIYAPRMRDIETIDSELRLVAALRRAARKRAEPLPSIDVVDALLDERRELSEGISEPVPA
jgi:hypothetical protein